MEQLGVMGIVTVLCRFKERMYNVCIFCQPLLQCKVLMGRDSEIKNMLVQHRA